MDAVLTPTRMTAAEYLEWESRQEGKHEFIAGEVFAMTGARLKHNRVAGNGFAFLLRTLDGQPCGVFIADVKVQVEAADAYFYPDLVVTCDPRDLADENAPSIQHPWLIVEVLSESTAAYDRIDKFAHYRKIDSLTHYLLVEQTRAAADLFQKNAQGWWELHPLTANDTIQIERPHRFDWPVASLYAGVSFEPAEPGSPKP